MIRLEMHCLRQPFNHQVSGNRTLIRLLICVDAVYSSDCRLQVYGMILSAHVVAYIFPETLLAPCQEITDTLETACEQHGPSYDAHRAHTNFILSWLKAMGYT